MADSDVSAQVDALSTRVARIEKVLGLQALPSTGETGQTEAAAAGSGQSNGCGSHASLICVADMEQLLK
ncbi:hypothetical protein ACFCV8_23805 [Streptomyces sp. NPDC056347]|uniref:hypothetical protein n=1 Tax=Streptomyces sp. NPDC056347 TaxID=3345790 RepID=UPI0035D80891